jgi:hypothetical protein
MNCVSSVLLLVLSVLLADCLSIISAGKKAFLEELFLLDLISGNRNAAVFLMSCHRVDIIVGYRPADIPIRRG